MKYLPYVCVIIYLMLELPSFIPAAKVIEMDDRLIDLSAQGKWLVMFYAPWCGHCRKLEPVMDEVAQFYKDKSPVTIVKVDATRFVKTASHFEIKAYPTVKFISGKKIINFSGERRKSDIIDFISKADSPRVTRILNEIDFEHSKTKHKHFFLLISTANDESTSLVKEFYELANIYFLDAYFYHAKPEQVLKAIEVNNTPTIGVIKENEFFRFDINQQELVNFVKSERFLTFTEITMSNFHNLIETRKTLIILNLDTENKLRDKQNKKLVKLYKTFSKENRALTHKEFQFGYVDRSDLLNGIAIWTLTAPLLFVFNTTAYTYSMFELIHESNLSLIDLNIHSILDDIRLNQIEFYGGETYLRRFQRPLWELYRAIIEMFIEAPFLSLLIFGFPFMVISIVFYFLCCVDTSDQDEEMMENSDSEDELNDEDYEVDEEPAPEAIATPDPEIKKKQ